MKKFMHTIGLLALLAGITMHISGCTSICLLTCGERIPLEVSDLKVDENSFYIHPPYIVGEDLQRRGFRISVLTTYLLRGDRAYQKLNGYVRGDLIANFEDRLQFISLHNPEERNKSAIVVDGKYLHDGFVIVDKRYFANNNKKIKIRFSIQHATFQTELATFDLDMTEYYEKFGFN